MSGLHPRICLIYTGGTIGMVRDPGTEQLRPPDNPRDFLQLEPELKSLFDYDFVPLLNKDSTNVVPADWTLIAEKIYELRNEGYLGFVVVHGTDTMHFSASAVAFALGPGLRFPVVFTGAQTIPEVRHGDARVNLLRACKVATEDVAEVVIAFGDYVFRGARCQKKDESKFDAFESPATFPLGYITETIRLSSDAKRRDQKSGLPFQLKSAFASGVVQVSLIPGLEPEVLEPMLARESCHGVILQSFGNGNVPNEDAGEYSLIPFIERATAMNKPVIITSQFPANATMNSAYQPGQAAIKAGAITTGNMTASCAVAKFRWALAQLDEPSGSGSRSRARLQALAHLMNEPQVDELDR